MTPDMKAKDARHMMEGRSYSYMSNYFCECGDPIEITQWSHYWNPNCTGQKPCEKDYNEYSELRNALDALEAR